MIKRLPALPSSEGPRSPPSGPPAPARSLAALHSFKQVIGPRRTPLSYQRSALDVSDITQARRPKPGQVAGGAPLRAALDVSDIEGSRKKPSLFERAKTRDFKLDVSDIAQPKKRPERRAPVNPLDPEYSGLDEQGRVSRFGPIPGSKPKKFTFLRPRDPLACDLSLRTSDIRGAAPKQAAAAKGLRLQQKLIARLEAARSKAATPTARRSSRAADLTLPEPEDEERFDPVRHSYQTSARASPETSFFVASPSTPRLPPIATPRQSPPPSRRGAATPIPTLTPRAVVGIPVGQRLAEARAELASQL